MKKWLILFTLWIFSSFTFAFSQSDLITQLQRPENIQGYFTQARFLRSLSQPIESRGQFTLVKNQGLLWQMQSPFATDMRVTAKEIAQRSGNQWVIHQKIGQGEQIRLFLGLLSGDVDGLKTQFDIRLSGHEENWQLWLIPSSLLMKQIFTEIKLKGGQSVEQIILSETQGDRVEIYFSEQRFNQALTPAQKQDLGLL